MTGTAVTDPNSVCVASVPSTCPRLPGAERSATGRVTRATTVGLTAGGAGAGAGAVWRCFGAATSARVVVTVLVVRTTTVNVRARGLTHYRSCRKR